MARNLIKEETDLVYQTNPAMNSVATVPITKSRNHIGCGHSTRC